VRFIYLTNRTLTRVLIFVPVSQSQPPMGLPPCYDGHSGGLRDSCPSAACFILLAWLPVNGSDTAGDHVTPFCRWSMPPAPSVLKETRKQRPQYPRLHGPGRYVLWGLNSLGRMRQRLVVLIPSHRQLPCPPPSPVECSLSLNTYAHSRGSFKMWSMTRGTSEV